MKQYFIQLLKVYLFFVVLFVLQKLLFMLFYNDLYSVLPLSEWFAVIYHGLQLDASVAGYLTVIPVVFTALSLWVDKRQSVLLFNIYFGFISAILSIITVADLALYRYWGFRLDSTPLFYLKTPKDALASASLTMIVVGVVSMVAIAWLVFRLSRRLIIRPLENSEKGKNRIAGTLLIILSLGVLFLPIRGGITVSTMNVGKVYFSDKMELNHAAVNPFFSLMESLTQEQDFGKQFRFMPGKHAQRLFATLQDRPDADTVPELFTTRRPNVIFIVLESFMSKVVEPLGGIPDVAPRLSALCHEGVLFTNVYANSFRTDRGLVSIFSAYPAQPNTSIMKYPHKIQNLPSIPTSLKNAGYHLQYYYGGDADFTNMRSYLISMGIRKIVSDKDFPVKFRMSKWGVPDHIVFERLAADLQKDQQQPFMKILQTSSSHEPFDVPCHRFAQPYLNSVAYTDSCLGAFIDQMRKKSSWKNTIIVLVPDHAMRYPETLENHSIERHRIPLLFVGGAIRQARRVDTYASQTDIAATLLAQFKIDHSNFTFSKNILNPASPHFGYFTYPNGFGMITPDNHYVYDCDSRKAVVNEGRKNLNKAQAEAYLQILYDDLSKR